MADSSGTVGTIDTVTLIYRIGDQALRYLVIHTSLYKPLANNSYLQLTGLPLCDLYEGRKKPSAKRKRERVDGGGRKKRKIEQRGREASSQGMRTGSAASNIGDDSANISPADVYISRQRMFYGQGSKGNDGRFTAGLHPQRELGSRARH